MSTTLRIQVGVEKHTDKARTARLTPLDKRVQADEVIASVVMLAVGIADASDDQPGDGEIDFALGMLDELAPDHPLLFGQAALLKPFLGKGWNAFARVTTS